jgi:hypothetical protein
MVKMEADNLWNGIRSLGMQEIIRRTAEAAGVTRKGVSERIVRKRDEFVVVTDIYAAFLVACDLGVAERIADGHRADGVESAAGDEEMQARSDALLKKIKNSGKDVTDVTNVTDNICPECGAPLIRGMGNDPTGDDGVRCPNGCDIGAKCEGKD